jgi:hypothetical protein
MDQGNQISATQSSFCRGSTPVSVSTKRMISVISHFLDVFGYHV